MIVRKFAFEWKAIVLKDRKLCCEVYRNRLLGTVKDNHAKWFTLNVADCICVLGMEKSIKLVLLRAKQNLHPANMATINPLDSGAIPAHVAKDG